MKWSDEKIYKGQWKNGKMEGTGTYFTPNYTYKG